MFLAFVVGTCLSVSNAIAGKEKNVPTQKQVELSHTIVRIVTIPHKWQEYDTAGNWHVKADGKEITISVSRMHDQRYEFLVALHELIEAYLCKTRGISETAVTAFDKAHLAAAEPGDLPDAPYFREHVFATKIERMLADELGVNWHDYNAAVEALSK
jgi:hypothetical protein